MKSFVMVLTLFLFSVPLAGQAEDLSASASQETSSVSAQQAAITARFAAVNTIESRFTQEKHMALLDEPVTSEGIFYFEKPGRIRWQYTKPFQNGFLIEKTPWPIIWRFSFWLGLRLIWMRFPNNTACNLRSRGWC